MTPLADRLAAGIAAIGPMRLDRWMEASNATYYAQPRTLGRDFTTAPEIAQAFGELIGLWAADLWVRAGQPSSVILAELGPGRGVLMADAWRATARVPGFHAAAQVHLVETSPALTGEQRARVPDAHWHDRLDDIPPGPLLLIANEFVDALPIRQFIRTAEGWRDRAVAHGADGFALALGDPVPDGAIPDAFADAPQGAIYEDRPAARALAATLGRRLAREGGAALFVDYGHPTPGLGDTLQAVQGGQRVDPFGAPGEADITAHVDFAALAEAAVPARVHGPIAQGLFLPRLGLAERTDALARANPAQAAALHAAAARLTAPAQMGALFHALGVTAPDWPIPAGFTA